MNGLAKVALRVSNSIKSSKIPGALLVNRAQVGVKRDFTRDIWHMCSSRQTENLGIASALLNSPSKTCSCGCGMREMHTKEFTETPKEEPQSYVRAEKELVEFLTEEIVAERKAQKNKSLPKEIAGFSVTTEGGDVTLTKKGQDETITVSFNVNHTVDSDVDLESGSDKQEFAEMTSKPQFEVDIIRGAETLGFTCSFLQDSGPQDQNDEYNDIFGIDEVTLYSGEWSDKVYAVSGDVLDGYLYDLLMNLLDEKGISNDFVNKISEMSTIHEHASYINLLERLSKFTIGKN